MAQNTLSTSPNTVHQEIEEFIQIPIYPGTEVMTDSKTQALRPLNVMISKPALTFICLVGSLHYKHAGKNVLVPQPSDDPSDPLNWNLKWKMLTMAGMSITTFSWTVGPLSISSQVPYYMAEWDRSLPDVIKFVCASSFHFSVPCPILTRFTNQRLVSVSLF